MDNTDPTDPLRTLEKDDTEDLFQSAFNGSAGVIKITSDSDCEPGQSLEPSVTLIFIFDYLILSFLLLLILFISVP